MSIDQVAFLTPDADVGRRLIPVARHIFSETFGHLYDPAQFEAFCDDVFSPAGRMGRDLAAPEVRWHVATVDGEPIGYAKLVPLRAPAIDLAPGSLELQQLYVLSPWHGSGVAETLMQWAVATARADGARQLYLTVFEHNERAKRFYTRHGFVDVGHYPYRIGDRVDEDRIWCKSLACPA
jgi:GNAT superfamily N-acetyltransferase